MPSVVEAFLLASARAVLSLVLLAAIAGCTTTGVGSAQVDTAASSSNASGGLQLVKSLPPPPNTDNGLNQPIASNDVLEVDVFQVSDLNRTVTVDANGMITLPLIGDVPAAGKSVDALQTDIKARYGAKYLQSPDVTVSMKDSAGQRVTVSGQVSKAGLYPTTSTTTLIQAIAQAGGLTSIADDNKIFVFRNHGKRRLVARYSVADISEGKAPDPRIYGGDVIVAFSSGTAIAMQNLRQALGLATSAATLGGL